MNPLIILLYHESRVSGPRRRGFTLIELLVVISIALILAGLLLPVLGRTKDRIYGVACSNNLRQVQTAFALYVDDSNDFVPWNWPYVRHSWVYSGDYGRLASKATGCTNLEWLVNTEYAGFAAYASNPTIYRCPSDRTTVSINGQKHIWVRSYGASFIQRKMSGFERAVSVAGNSVLPSRHRTFDEVHPGYLHELDGCWTSTERMITAPAYRHGRQGTFAFVDGHVESHRWQDARTRRPENEGLRFIPSGVPTPEWSERNRDVQWLLEGVDSGLGYERQDEDVARFLSSTVE